MRIDAHQHFWLLAERAGQWPPSDLAAIYRDFLPEDLLPTLDACRVDGTVVVQSMPTVADTEFLLALADRHPFILGVVGWVDLKAADAPAEIARLARHPRFKGLRPMLQDLPDDNWIDDPALEPAIAAMIEHGLCFDALVFPRHLPALERFVRRYPALPVVIDHAAKPPIASGELAPWRQALADLAALPNVHCKLSGLLTEAGSDRSLAALQPWVETVLQLFGPRRVLWGSDWPVLRLAGSYEQWLAQCAALCDTLTPAESAAVFGRNAQRFYRLAEPGRN
jgi:L-fuconolactonase